MSFEIYRNRKCVQKGKGQRFAWTTEEEFPGGKEGKGRRGCLKRASAGAIWKPRIVSQEVTE